MTKTCSCQVTACSSGNCGRKDKCSQGCGCVTCKKRLYERYNYHDICLCEFSVVINCNNFPIEGFILAFVDNYGNPILFDENESYMSVEILKCCNSQLVSCHNKCYYTYVEQEENCLPINPALWTFRYPTSAKLRLAFRLKPIYRTPMNLHINMFYGQGETPQCTLAPVISHAICEDQSRKCTKTPDCPGFVSWMVSLQECYYRHDCHEEPEEKKEPTHHYDKPQDHVYDYEHHNYAYDDKYEYHYKNDNTTAHHNDYDYGYNHGCNCGCK